MIHGPDEQLKHVTPQDVAPIPEVHYIPLRDEDIVCYSPNPFTKTTTLKTTTDAITGLFGRDNSELRGIFFVGFLEEVDPSARFEREVNNRLKSLEQHIGSRLIRGTNLRAPWCLYLIILVWDLCKVTGGSKDRMIVLENIEFEDIFPPNEWNGLLHEIQRLCGERGIAKNVVVMDAKGRVLGASANNKRSLL